MYRINRNSQTGYALILFVLMLMGIGGVVLGGFTQEAKKEVETERFLHNERILKEAKRALLQFAYNYPVTNQRGPGRLPCPDTDNNGQPNPSFYCINGTAIVGRFPWADIDLNFYDARDASGERLWYAVSRNFANTGPLVSINSDTPGTITIFDQAGTLQYDGSAAGVAAIIVAPGPAIDRNGVVQNRQTVAQTNNPTNYLDLFGVLDNATFTNNSAADGFVLGPVDNLAADTIIVNDQMILVTAEEVIAMAEKATLQAYRTALQAYDQRIDNDIGAGDYFPWLFNYEINDYGGGYPELDDYPSRVNFSDEKDDYLGREGRVPSIFASYFTESDSQPIESRLKIELTLEYPSSVDFDQPSAICPENPTGPNCTSGTLDFDVASDHDIEETTSAPLTGVKFEDLADIFGMTNRGRLSATVVTADTFTDVKYFWDEEPVGDGWTECGGSANEASDCNRNSGGVNIPQGSNDTPSQVLRVRVDITLPAAAVINFDLDYATPPDVEVVDEADGNRHAQISATFDGSDIEPSTLPVIVSYGYDSFYDSSFDVQASGTLSLGDLLSDGELSLEMRYYPELPQWVFDNGWYDSVLMAYAEDFEPDESGGPCVVGTDCLEIDNFAGVSDNKISILVIAGEHNWIDGGTPNLDDDVGDIFNAENANLNDTYDVGPVNGSDKILVVCDQVGGVTVCY